MSSILAFFTSPDGIAVLTGVAGALGLNTLAAKAKRKLRALVDDALGLLHLVERNAKGAAAIAADPDRALEGAIKAAAKAAGVTVNAKELREALGQLALRRELAHLAEGAAELQRTLERARLGQVAP